MSRLHRLILLFISLTLTILLAGCLKTEHDRELVDDATQVVDEVRTVVDDIIDVIKEGDIEVTAIEPVQWTLEEETEPIATPESEAIKMSEPKDTIDEDTISSDGTASKDYLYLDDAWFYDDILYTLFEAIVNKDEHITVEAIDTDYFDELCDSLYAIIGKTQYKYDIDGLHWTSDGRQIKVDIQYNTAAVQHSNQLMMVAQKIADQIFTDSMTDVEKMVTAYQYLQLNTRYDEEAADRIDDGNYSSAHHGYGALVEGKAVCEGYASAFNVLLNMEGIETRLIESATMNHVWSMAKLNGEWYHCDVTFDDKLPDTKNNADYEYFLKNDQYMIDDDIGRNVSDKPLATGFNYHYDIYSSEWYTIDNTDYIYKLIDGVLYRDNVSDHSIDMPNAVAIVTDVGSWVSSPDDYTIIYVTDSNNQLISIDFDGGNQRVLGSFNANGIVLDVASIGDAYVLTCTSSMNGATSQINVNK